MLFELTEDYLPSALPFREPQLKQIEQIFSQFATYKRGSNLILLGGTGAGKTSAIKKIINEHNNSLYFSADQCKTTYQLLCKIANVGKRNFISDVYETILERMQNNPTILIIDEIGKLKDIEELGDFLNFLYRRTSMPVILITNQYDFVKKMKTDAQLTLLFEKVIFPSYNALQIREILHSRVAEILPKLHGLTIPEGRVDHISALCVRNHSSSMRTALRIFSNCVIRGDFSFDTIQYLSERMESEDIQMFLDRLHPTERVFIETVSECIENSKNKDGVSLQTIQQLMGQPISLARISQIASSFIKNYCLLEGTRVGNGRAMGVSFRVKFIDEETRERVQNSLKNCFDSFEGVENKSV